MLALGQRGEIIIAWVGRTAGRIPGIGGHDCRASKQRHEIGGGVSRDPSAEFRIRERTLELGEQRLGDDELELAGQPAGNESAPERRPGRAEQR